MSPDGRAPGQSVDTVGAIIYNGTIEHAFRADGMKTAGSQLSAAARRVLLNVPADGRIHGEKLADVGGYRVVASKLNNGEIIVTGPPTKDIRRRWSGRESYSGAHWYLPH